MVNPIINIFSKGRLNEPEQKKRKRINNKLIHAPYLTEYIIDVLTTSLESFSLKYLNKDASIPLEYNVLKKAKKVYIIKIIPVSLGVNKFV